MLRDPAFASTRVVKIAARIFVLFALASAPAGDSPCSAGQGSSASAAMEALERSFREESADALRPLLSGQEKIRVSSPALGLNPGYYSGDQIYYVLEDLFRRRATIRFDLLKGKAGAPSQAVCVTPVGRWTYRKGKSREFSAEIAFTMVKRDQGWCLKEIRDLP